MLWSLILSFFYCSAPHGDLHSFPTRRSSDLRRVGRRRGRPRAALRSPRRAAQGLTVVQAEAGAVAGAVSHYSCSIRARSSSLRSEEHTSELQSHSDLVCRLLLEKKKKKNNER